MKTASGRAKGSEVGVQKSPVTAVMPGAPKRRSWYPSALFLRAYLEGDDGEMRNCRRASMETEPVRNRCPRRRGGGSVQCLQGEQADGSLGYHAGASVKMCKLFIGDAEGTDWKVWGFAAVQGVCAALSRMAVQQQAVGMFRSHRQPLPGVSSGVCVPFRDCRDARRCIVCNGVPVFQHAGGNGGRGMFAVGEDAYFGGTLYEGTVELLPGRPVRGDGAHVVIRHDEAVCQCLQGVESGIEQNVCLRKLTLYGIGKTEEQRVAGREYNDGVVRSRLFEAGKYFFIMGKDTVQRYGDGNPFGPGNRKDRQSPYAVCHRRRPSPSVSVPVLPVERRGTVVIHSMIINLCFIQW